MIQNVKKVLETLSLLNSVSRRCSKILKKGMCLELYDLQSYENSFSKLDKKVFVPSEKFSYIYIQYIYSGCVFPYFIGLKKVDFDFSQKSIYIIDHIDSKKYKLSLS